MKRLPLAVLVNALWWMAPAGGQEKPEPANTYRVQIVIRDAADTGAKAGRRYAVLVESSPNSRGSLRIGHRVPYSSGPSQFSYADVGVNIDCRVRESAGKLLLGTEMDISSLSKDEKGEPPQNPIVGQSRVVTTAFVTPGKPVVIASIDDPVTGRKLDVEATITKMD